MKYGIIGDTFEKDNIAVAFRFLFGEGEICALDIGDFQKFLSDEDFRGAYVCKKYAKALLPYISDLSPEALKCGYANVIVKLGGGALYGDCTEGFAFSSYMRYCKANLAGKKVLIIGEKEDFREIYRLTEDEGAAVYTYSEASPCTEADIIINLSSCGALGNEKKPVCPTDYKKLSAYFDTVSNPAKTKTVLECERTGVSAFGGLYYIAASAVRSCEIITGNVLGEKWVYGIYTRMQKEVKNLVLIGMPGSGKTVIAKRIAEILGKDFYDIDSEITAGEGKTPSKIIEEDGEEAFRLIESRYTEKICSKSGAVISTGGGVVTRDENYYSLKKNSLVVYLIRKTEDLTKRNRPLSNARPIEEIAAERIPKYKAWSDVKILNCGINQTVGEIIRFIKLKAKK